jgi:iron complex transport system substrate-binding protein
VKKAIAGAMVFLLSLACALVCKAQTEPAPQRIASLNICLDQLLWEMVDHERLVSISYLSANPVWSPIASEVIAAGMTDKSLNHGLAEEIVPLKPDIVLAGEFDAPDSVGLLEKLGFRVERMSFPTNLEGITTQIIELAELVGAQHQAQQMLAEIDARIVELELTKQSETSLTAFWYSANGVVIGDGTLEHEFMQLAGLHNLAAERGIFGFKQLDLELLLSAKPQILIVEQGSDSAYSLAREYLSHPALKQANFKVINLPVGLSSCAASAIGDVATRLRNTLAN